MPSPSSKHPAPHARPRPGRDLNEVVRRRRLREQGRRSLAENLAEGLALSEFLTSFTGAAKK